jgi:peptidyl-dipeptidase Dcp
LPAIEEGIREQLAEVKQIANNPDAPTFDNTIVALERSGALLERATTIFFNLNATLTSPEMQSVQRILAPKLAAQSDAIRLQPALFSRVEMLYAARDKLGLDAQDSRLLWRYHQDFVRAGAKLCEEDKTRLRTLNGELATLQTAFSQNVLQERAAKAVLFDTPEELIGLAPAEVHAAQLAATDAGKLGKFQLNLVNTTDQPVLARLQSHASRLKVMAASLARGSDGGDFDNRTLVSDIANKRAKQAVLLGYPNHAAYQLAEQTVGGVSVLNDFLMQLAPVAVANARKEAADLQAVIYSEEAGFKLDGADWAFYTEKVRAARYAFDGAQLKPYFEMNRVLTDGVFFAAHKLYGLNFKERFDLPVYESSVRVFDIFNEDGTPLALFVFDPYARASKNGGAWMSAYVPQNGLIGDQPVVANHLNLAQPPAGQPTLMSVDEVTTAFHEFGHALHGMFSQVRYPRFSGTNVPRDFVEFPSQVNEMWALWPEVLRNYAKHYQTGEPIPQTLLDQLSAAAKFNEGYRTTEYLAATLLDQAWHQTESAHFPDADGVLAFEANALKKYGMDFAAVSPRYRSTYFSHVFAGGYSAGYYSYIWSEVLDADSVQWIKDHGGLTRANGDRLRSTVLSRGGSSDAMQLFRDFTGKDPDIKPLIRRRGL